MDFLKNFFNDEGKIIGLCGFKSMKTGYPKNRTETDFFFNPFQCEKVFETNYSKNALLL